MIPRDDDASFGILSSRIHVVWVLRAGSTLEDRPVYTTGRVLEPFPFPRGMTLATPLAQIDNPHAHAVAAAASKLNELRENWLNPADWVTWVPEVTQPISPRPAYPPRLTVQSRYHADWKERSLTSLYNDRPSWLIAAHERLDQAVALAYGWADYSCATSDDEIVARLLALNAERCRTQGALFA